MIFITPDDYHAQVKYANNLEASLGNELTPTQVKDIPTLKWDAEKDAYYTVLMVDPDAPSRAKPMFEVRHWLVMNVPGDEVEKGETISEFIGSGPPEGTGLHRYIFLIYKQPNGKITHDEPHTTNRCVHNSFNLFNLTISSTNEIIFIIVVYGRSREHRFDSNARKFVEKHNLGVPQFGNFYQAQYDDYVPKLHAQLSGQ